MTEPDLNAIARHLCHGAINLSCDANIPHFRISALRQTPKRPDALQVLPHFVISECSVPVATDARARMGSISAQCRQQVNTPCRMPCVKRHPELTP